MVWQWITGIIVLALIFFVIYVWNNLITLRNRVDNEWSQIDIQLKRRYDLIPNLVSIVKGYLAHEKGVLKSVTEERGKLIKGSPQRRAKAEDKISTGLKNLFAVAENYPRLKASKNFLDVQKQLSETESKISYARMFYNEIVEKYNNAVQMFPYSLIAKMFGFEKRDFFKADERERQSPKVET